MGRLRSWAQVIRAVLAPSEHLAVDSAYAEVTNEDLRSADARKVHSRAATHSQHPSGRPAPTTPRRRARVDELAWDVVETSRSHFTRSELSMIFVNLGVDEHESVIQMVLERHARDGLGLETDLTDRLKTLVAMYQGSPTHAVLDALLTTVTGSPAA